ncbi:putative signal peptide-containing protein [Cryptosporidium parvum]
MFNYLKLFLILAILLNFSLLLLDRVFINHFSNTPFNPDSVSKYSLVKLKSGFARPLSQAAGRNVPRTGNGSAGFRPVPPCRKNSRVRIRVTSSEDLARILNDSMRHSQGANGRFRGLSSSASSSMSPSDFHGSTSTGPGKLPRNFITQSPQFQSFLQSQIDGNHFSTGGTSVTSRNCHFSTLSTRSLGTSPSSSTSSSDFHGSTSTGPGKLPRNFITQSPQFQSFLQSQIDGNHFSTGGLSKPTKNRPGPPFTRPVGYLSANCPRNSNSRHFFKPGAGRRMPCEYCDKK